MNTDVALAANERKKILVVDDNEIILQTVAAKLEDAGYLPLIAEDGGEAVDVALRETLDLIVVDINFAPDVYGVAWDGFHILERLWDLEFVHNVPIILVSSHENEQDLALAQKYGVAAFYHKPITHPGLAEVIRRTLQLVPVA